MKKRQNGISLIEALGALFVGALMLVGLSAMINSTLDDTKAQQVALYQAQVASAAAKYITANYDAVVAAAGATVPHTISVNTLKSTGFLSSSFQDKNAYGQTPCVLVLEPTTNKLDALIVTEGGTDIPTKDIAYVSANAGQGGGYIASATEAKGAFGSWRLTNPLLANYLSTSCSGTQAAPNHLATALFYDGPGQIASEFLYRNRVAGHPELNQMTTPLHMKKTIAENSSDSNAASESYCHSTKPDSWGRIAVDANGSVLSCREGFWKRYGSGSWKDPVSTYAALPTANNNPDDVRMVTALNRAFTWKVSGGVGSWVALAVDQNGTLTTDNIQINGVVVKGATCTSTGLVARDTNGLLLSCQFGIWTTQTALELGASAPGDVVILKSNYISYPSGTVFYTGTIAYDPADDWYTATIKRTVQATKNGVLAVNMTSRMNRELWNSTTQEGQLEITIAIVDKDTNTIIGTSQNMSLRFANDSTASSVNLTKAVQKNTNGYEVRIITRWSTYNGNGTTGNGLYTRANYKDAQGTVVEETPIRTNWTLDLFY
jgi:type II secretory pathway pseudopilin PulG